jgi:hypothetical protein
MFVMGVLQQVVGIAVKHFVDLTMRFFAFGLTWGW